MSFAGAMNGLIPNRARKLDPPKSKVRTICQPLDYEHVLFLACTLKQGALLFDVVNTALLASRAQALRKGSSWLHAVLQRCVCQPEKENPNKPTVGPLATGRSCLPDLERAGAPASWRAGGPAWQRSPTQWILGDPAACCRKCMPGHAWESAKGNGLGSGRGGSGRSSGSRRGHPPLVAHVDG